MSVLADKKKSNGIIASRRIASHRAIIAVFIVAPRRLLILQYVYAFFTGWGVSREGQILHRPIKIKPTASIVEKSVGTFDSNQGCDMDSNENNCTSRKTRSIYFRGCRMNSRKIVFANHRFLAIFLLIPTRIRRTAVKFLSHLKVETHIVIDRSSGANFIPIRSVRFVRSSLCKSHIHVFRHSKWLFQYKTDERISSKFWW